MRGLALMAALALGILLIEGLLRATGFGYPTRFYRESEHEGRAVIRENPAFSRRFFPPSLTRYPTSFRIPAVKGDDTYRIFLFGGSVAEGDPEPAFSISRTLRVLLREAHPHVRFEVVNAGVTAINSHVALTIAEDCAELDPDLFVAYLGHNEVIGPFGPATVFSPFLQSRPLIRLSIGVKGTKTGQLLDGMLGGAFAGRAASREWGGINMFLGHEIDWDDPRLEKTYDFFGQNLDGLYRAGRQAGAHVLLCTAPSNVRDFPPFASRHRRKLTDEELAAWTRHRKAAEQRLASGDPGAARRELEAALEIDDSHAETHYRLGRIHLDDGRRDEARRHLVLARDRDGLRCRADSRINDVVRELGRRDLPGLEVVDVVESLEQESGAGIAGNEFFYEQVHLTYRGIYQVAVSLFDRVQRDLVRRRLVDETARVVPLSAKETARRLAFTLWEQYRINENMLSRFSHEPYTGQSNQRLRLEEFRRRAALAERALSGEGVRERILAEYDGVLAGDPGDWVVARLKGKMLRDWGDIAGAIEILERANREQPDDKDTLYALGMAYLDGSRLEEAERTLLKLERIVPYLPQIDYHLGEINLRRERQAKAAAYFRRNLQRYPDSRRTVAALADAYDRMGETRKAVDCLTSALARHADDAGLHHLAGTLMLKLGRRAEGLKHLERAVELAPENAVFRDALDAARRGAT